MDTAAKFVDGSEISLTCWLDWYDGPVSGLAQWEGNDVWFRLNSDAGEEVRIYELFALMVCPRKSGPLFELVPASIMELRNGKESQT